MAGHSKWANIQHRKNRQDAKKGAVWTKVIREIIVAARNGGADLSANPRLRMAVDKAKEANMPTDTIKRNIDKATGNLAGVIYEEIRYEGYGIAGVAVLVDTMTDNKVRTVADVRHIFSKYAGNLGTEGSVAYQFKRCGQFFFAPNSDEDKIMEIALDAGADDVLVAADDGSIAVICQPESFEMLLNTFIQQGLKAEVATITMRADNSIDLTVEESEKMQKLLDALEDHDDVQEVYHNAQM